MSFEYSKVLSFEICREESIISILSIVFWEKELKELQRRMIIGRKACKRMGMWLKERLQSNKKKRRTACLSHHEF